MEFSNLPNLLVGFMGFMGGVVSIALILVFYVTSDEHQKANEGKSK